MDDKTLDRLVRRYSTGDRDPELLRQLTQAAWEGFHDPWERRPDGEDFRAGCSLENPEPIVERLHPGMLEAALAYFGLKFWKQDENRFLIRFDYDADSDREQMVLLAIEGSEQDILALRSFSDRRVLSSEIPKALELCNRWNQTHRWPRAYLWRLDEPLQASSKLALDNHYELKAGIHQDLLNGLIQQNLEASWSFWEAAARECGL